ncbi:MAG: hypothetical protein ACXWZM_07585 [Solirubrobacterales bacterium]
MRARLERLEAIVDRAGVAERIEALLPVGVRPRQLRVRTLLLGMLLAACDGRPAHLSRVREALLGLPEAERRRLGVLLEWKSGPHELTYRQVERTFGLLTSSLASEEPDGTPSEALGEILDRLLEASVEVAGKPETSSYAVDWTDLEAFSRPPPKGSERCADPEASWGHRRGDGPGEADEAFFGYYLQVATCVREERGPEVPELVRRIQIASCDVDPPPALVPTIERMAESGIAIGDVLADSGYAYRRPESWALPLRRLGASLVQELHPNDRGAQGTHMGTVRANGNLYCPATPAALLELGPLARGASEEETAAHDRKAGELARHKLSPITGYDRDGYRRVACPAAAGKLRCPLRPESMGLPHALPEVPDPPQHPPRCCAQKTITVPPSVNAKTAQKHDYPSKAHRRSYARRSAAERAYATVKDPATNDISRGWCRLAGLAPIALFAASVFVARNLRVADAFAARQAEEERRVSRGLPPKRRRRRRQTAEDLIGAANAPP